MIILECILSIFSHCSTHTEKKNHPYPKRLLPPKKNEKTKAKFIITKPLSLIECYYTLLCKTKTINDMKIFFTIIRSKKAKKLSGKYLSNHIIVLWAINSRKMHYFEYIHYYLLHENLPIIKCTISPEYPPSIYYYSRPLLRKKALILFYYSKKQNCSFFHLEKNNKICLVAMKKNLKFKNNTIAINIPAPKKKVKSLYSTSKYHTKKITILHIEQKNSLRKKLLRK